LGGIGFVYGTYHKPSRPWYVPCTMVRTMVHGNQGLGRLLGLRAMKGECILASILILLQNADSNNDGVFRQGKHQLLI
jgi:hypothetical protein